MTPTAEERSDAVVARICLDEAPLVNGSIEGVEVAALFASALTQAYEDGRRAGREEAARLAADAISTAIRAMAKGDGI